ncbi:MAG: 4Fe-4S dicluster domain-containing protein [Acidimicrobiia bacterium]|nr:4Fe-4S dicluster domain-containing protein [Acidimicrobiia bacterium]
MAKVYNWQLGREMEYPYAGGDRERQFAAVFNINRCIACQTCTMACKSTWTHYPGQELMFWNNVETKPYGGYPRSWDAKLLEMQETLDPGGQNWAGTGQADVRSPYGRFDGKTIFETANGTSERVTGYLPDDDEWKAPNNGEDHGTKMGPDGAKLPVHQGWFFYLQRICNHCSYPACLAACPRNAIYKRKEDGIVLIDQERCRGYRKCVAACPYKKSMYRPTTRTSEKCIACYPRIEGQDPISDGVPMETRCMASCIGKIRMQGLVQVEADATWTHDPRNPIYYMVHVEKVALPLYPQFGTQPNIYYIPPRWAPREYLRQMFGPGVDAAIEKYANPSRELLALLQLFRATREVIFAFDVIPGPVAQTLNVGGRSRTIYDDTVVGYDAKGREVARVKVVEPVVTRPGSINSI